MKPKLFFIILMFCASCFSAVAQQATKETGTQVITLDQQLTSLVIENDLTVILTQNESNEIKLEGDRKEMSDIRVGISDGRVVLSQARSHYKTGVRIYIPSRHLTRIDINGKANLSSSTVLHNKKLKIMLAEEAHINVQSTGKVVVDVASDIQYVPVAKLSK